ncbi:phosphoribosylamine--glycine ligase [Ferruginibacter sp. HRS2-29]|uniref:phosphoribosylamine--glycine ligase n=1 Tax=Ferruginibacter sp. HRS2-29 TaxID=2487334 RepID=UPI0020CD434F|nr:phosphoribosylamine--glycine ligase [Ferruginibacter sp. HRS2-29]MCP9750511.1 phosphoribosylamine--glycine ligase [Ferruginibacter sp. HRS2-29]
MKILLVGSGGREHTLAWKLKQSNKCEALFIAPGNAGTALTGTNLDVQINDFEGLSAACLQHSIEMVIVGPEEPLVKGITDFFKNDPNTAHIHIIGPSGEAAQLEGSKAFAKAFMKKYDIPTAAYEKFNEENYTEGVEYIRSHSLPIVLKADGLAAGKGVVICNSHLEALAEFELMVLRSKFGEAGRRVIVEEFLQGIEMSVFVLTDGKDYVLLPEAKDYKKIGEGDKGLNTGGMGAVSPVPFFDEELKKKITEKIIKPTIAGLQKEQLDYKGFVFIGLIVENNEAKVIEYNCRLGDPETEVVIPRLQNDLVDLLLATSQGRINEIEIDTDPSTAVAVVAVSGGYPGNYEKGKVIEGLDSVEIPGSFVFHSGTKKNKEEIVTNGGRVLVVTSYGENIQEAAEQSTYLLEQLYFEDIYFRSDIGFEFTNNG